MIVAGPWPENKAKRAMICIKCGKKETALRNWSRFSASTCGHTNAVISNVWHTGGKCPRCGKAGGEGKCPVPILIQEGVTQDRCDAWLHWYTKVAARWKSFVRGPAAEEAAQIDISAKGAGGLPLRLWREHLLLEGRKYTACVRCWRYGAGRQLSWIRQPCNFGCVKPGKGLRAVFASGEFDGQSVQHARRPSEARRLLQIAGLWRQSEPEWVTLN